MEGHDESTTELKHATENNEAIGENAVDDEAKVMQLSAYHSLLRAVCMFTPQRVGMQRPDGRMRNRP